MMHHDGENVEIHLQQNSFRSLPIMVFVSPLCFAEKWHPLHNDLITYRICEKQKSLFSSFQNIFYDPQL